MYNVYMYNIAGMKKKSKDRNSTIYLQHIHVRHLVREWRQYFPKMLTLSLSFLFVVVVGGIAAAAAATAAVALVR